MQGVAALVFGFILMALFVAIVVYDIQHQIIPDEYVLALVGVVLLAAPFSLMRDFDGWRTYLDMFVSGVTVALPFVVLWVISKGKWIGLGDGKLAFVFGLLFPFPYAVSALVLAVWAGAVYGLSMIGLRKVLHTKYAFNSAIAFGPFLIAGALYIYIYPVDVLGIMMWHEIVSQSLTVSSSAL